MSKWFVTALASALALGACSRSEQVSQKPQARIEAAQPAPDAGKTQEEIDAGLRERLARQEAAAKMFEKNVVSPPPPRAAEPKAPEALRKAEEARPAAPAALPKLPAPPAPQAVPATPPAAQPAPASMPAKAPETRPAETARAEPPRAAAVARPEPAPAKSSPSLVAPAPTATRLVNRVDPEFPREAIQAGIERGLVKVRLHLDPTGAVARVEVLDANPRRVFDRAVVRALTLWKFNEGAAGRTVETEVEFKR